MRVVKSKTQWAPVKRKLPDGGEDVGFIRIGSYVEFDDGHRIRRPDGSFATGRGTVARYNFKHCTWSVQAPERGELTRMGYVFVRGEPVWQGGGKVSGMSIAAFKRDYNARFVAMCMQAVVMGKIGAA